MENQNKLEELEQIKKPFQRIKQWREENKRYNLICDEIKNVITYLSSKKEIAILDKESILLARKTNEKKLQDLNEKKEKLELEKGKFKYIYYNKKLFALIEACPYPNLLIGIITALILISPVILMVVVEIIIRLNPQISKLTVYLIASLSYVGIPKLAIIRNKKKRMERPLSIINSEIDSLNETIRLSEMFDDTCNKSYCDKKSEIANIDEYLNFFTDIINSIMASRKKLIEPELDEIMRYQIAKEIDEQIRTSVCFGNIYTKTFK